MGSIGLFAQHSNVYLKMTEEMDLDLYATSNFSLYANNSNVSITANSNNLNLSATSNFSLYANNDNVSITANSNNLNLSACNINLNGDFSINKIILSSNMNVSYKFAIGIENDLELKRITSSNHIIISEEIIIRYANVNTMMAKM